MPSATKRSDGVGHILVLGAKRREDDLVGEKTPFDDNTIKVTPSPFQVKASASKLARESAALTEWTEMLSGESSSSPSAITHSTFGTLADSHRLRGGKWIAHVRGGPAVDNLWKRVAWSLAFGKFPDAVACASVTPVNDTCPPPGTAKEEEKAGGEDGQKKSEHPVS